MTPVLLTVLLLLAFACAIMYGYARLSGRTTAYEALDLTAVEVALETERMQLLRDALLDRLSTLRPVAEGSVLYHTAVTNTVEAACRADIAAATIEIDALWQYYTPVLAARHAREQRLQQVEELAEMWRGRLRGSRTTTPKTEDSRGSMRSMFFGD